MYRGDIYKGIMDHGLRFNGITYILYRDGSKYKGECLLDKKHGLGIFI